ncbi:MAG TPA: zinc metalloprotease HtpX [Kofleriaceae bacterium]|nr:zinc metalloprotease HtpX [Kofleriaceae bacterium]
MNQLKTILLFGVLSALFIGIGGAFAPQYLAVFVALAAVINLGAYFFSDRIVLAMYQAHEVSVLDAPVLHTIVSELAETAEIPMPRVYIIPERQPNAFATGRNPKHGVVAVTQGLLDLMDPRELRGVLAHELSHIKNRDILVSTVAAILASAISTVANVLSFGTLLGGRDGEDRTSLFAVLAMIIVGPLAALLVQLAISRSRELHADQTGAQLSGDPEGLAGALLKLHGASLLIAPEQPRPGTASLFIVNPFEGLERVSRWFSTHPSVEERVERLRALPVLREPAYAVL